MHQTTVRMKDGRTFCGSIWTFRPEEGWFSIPDDESAPDRIYLRDVASAVTRGDRCRYGRIEDVDLLERARRQGWQGD